MQSQRLVSGRTGRLRSRIEEDQSALAAARAALAEARVKLERIHSAFQESAEARLSITDIGFVRVGQTATVRLADREASVYSKIDGTVIHVAPDGRVFYLVRVETLQDSFSSGESTYRLFPRAWP